MNETLYAFRFDPLASGATAGDTIDIAYIRFYADEKAAQAFAQAEDPSLAPKANTYKIDFAVDGHMIYSTTYTDDGAPFDEPAVPHIPGKTGAWEPYSLENGGDLIVNAIYTDVHVEPEVSFVQTEAPTSQAQTEPPESPTQPTENERGCGALLSALPLSIFLIPALVLTKRKEDAQ
jgi:hypothetical protein